MRIVCCGSDKMERITIKGANNTGKTTLLKYAYKNLLSDGADVFEYDCNDFLTDDFYAYIIWHGIKIVFFSLGDSIKYVKEGVDKANYWKVDVLVNALTNSISESEYGNLLSGNEIFITMENKSDKENRVKQKQRKYYKELLSKLMEISESAKDK